MNDIPQRIDTGRSGKLKFPPLGKYIAKRLEALCQTTVKAHTPIGLASNDQLEKIEKMRTENKDEDVFAKPDHTDRGRL